MKQCWDISLGCVFVHPSSIRVCKVMLPDPGGPYNRYPRRYGTPRSMYHAWDERNSVKSANIRSPTPLSSTTDDSGRFLRGKPNCRQSMPELVYIIVLSCDRFSAASFASSSSPCSTERLRPNMRSVSVSQGDPVCMSTILFSRVRV